MKKKILGSALFLLTFSSLTIADTNCWPCWDVPQSALFGGLGGSYNSVNFDQNINLTGVSNVYSDSLLLASGQATGPVTPFNDTDSTFAPDAQIGYFIHFPCSNFLGGIKFNYQYLGLTFNDNNLVAPQVGTLTNTENAPTDTEFTGHALIGSVQTEVTHEMTLMPFIGESFKRSYVYLGVGPALFDTKENIYNVTGYADINGTHMDVSGTPQNFSDSDWMWGGAAQVGMTYYVSPTWFLDLNYTYAITGRDKINYSAPFSNTTAGTPYNTVGNLYGDTNQRIIAQGLTLTINKSFCF